MVDATEKAVKKKRGFKFPSTALLLLLVILVMTLLTYVVPAGEYDRVLDEGTGRTIVVPGSYRQVEQTPVGFWRMFMAPYNGIQQLPDILGMLLIAGAVMGVFAMTGAPQAAIGALARKVGKNETLLIWLMMIAFSLAGSILSAIEVFVAFAPLMVMVAMALGYDRMTGIGILLLGLYAGFSATPIGLSSTAIAHSIAELPLFSGFWYRTLMTVLATLLAMFHVARYAKKVKANPELGLTDLDARYDPNNGVKLDEYVLDNRKKVVLLLLVGAIAILVWGVMQQGWYLAEMTTLFMIAGLLVGVFYYSGKLDTYMGDFMKCTEIMAPAMLLVSLSRAIIVVLTEGQIIDTIIYGLSLPLQQLNGILAAWCIFFTQCILNLFVPSSSGQAVVAMPILTPLADIVGITRQVVCMAYQCADGFINMIIPTHPTMMTCLALAGIPFGKWFKFALPLVLQWMVLTMIFLAIGVLINWGPF